MASSLLFVIEGPNRSIHRWSGFLLMNVGETGNFISYAFAPASMVAPLGTVSSDPESACYLLTFFFQFALMANCFFAPLLLGEHFKKVSILLLPLIAIFTNAHPAGTSWCNNCYYRSSNGCPSFQCV